MVRILYFDEESEHQKNFDKFEVHFNDASSKEAVFEAIGLSLAFEVTPNCSWDAFIDQFREFTSNLTASSVVVFHDFRELSNHNFKLSLELLEVLVLIVSEHYSIIEDKYYRSGYTGYAPNKNVTVSLVVKTG